MSKKKYKTKDLDNVIKTLFDAMKGIVYQDDSQIRSVFANKYITDKTPGFMIGTKSCRKKRGARMSLSY